MKHEQLIVPSLGSGSVVSPLKQTLFASVPSYKFITDEDRIVYDVSLENFQSCLATGETPVSFEKAGPRETIYFEPAKTKAAIVTCGGLCPGLNNVMRSLGGYGLVPLGILAIDDPEVFFHGQILELLSSLQHLNDPLACDLLRGGVLDGLWWELSGSAFRQGCFEGK